MRGLRTGLLLFAVVEAFGGEVATYVGPANCISCHSGLVATNHPPGYYRGLVEACGKSAHASTMFDADKEPGKVVAPFDAGSPLRREQVAYALGAGRGEQRYCDTALTVLTSRWNVRSQEWQPQEAADVRRRCAACHTTGYSVTNLQWQAMGVTCESCHGPGSLHVKDSGKTRMLALRSLPVERRGMVCGQCHADGTDPAKVHPFPVDFRPGDDLTQFLVFVPRPRPGAKYTELARSKHGRMNVICVDCHDPHGPVEGAPHQLLRPVNELCLKCHGEKTMAKHAPQAPGDATCASCHLPDGAHTFRKPR